MNLKIIGLMFSLLGISETMGCVMNALSDDEQEQEPLFTSSPDRLELLAQLSHSVTPDSKASFLAQVSRSRSSSLDHQALTDMHQRKIFLQI